jgi:hypothetical protein
MTDSSSPVPIPQPALEALQRLLTPRRSVGSDPAWEADLALVRRHLSQPSSGRPEPSEEAVRDALLKAADDCDGWAENDERTRHRRAGECDSMHAFAEWLRLYARTPR